MNISGSADYESTCTGKLAERFEGLHFEGVETCKVLKLRLEPLGSLQLSYNLRMSVCLSIDTFPR